MFKDLPPEILLNITFFISCKDMSALRLVSKTMRTFCDHPTNWKSIYLEPEIKDHRAIPLWQLSELRDILSPHVSHIQSIRIWGVRDNIIYYLLSHCKNLQHLTICGWTTLSDHCLRLEPAQFLKIKTLKLIGSPQQTNYISVDAYTLGKLMIQSPEMTNLVFGCEIHIHAETFIAELEKSSTVTELQSFMVASRRTWLNEHVIRLIRKYPSIQKIYLMSTAAAVGFRGPEMLDAWITLQLQEEQQKIPITYHSYPLISTERMIVYQRAYIMH